METIARGMVKVLGEAFIDLMMHNEQERTERMGDKAARERRYIVTAGHTRFVFREKIDACALVFSISKADGTAKDYSQKDVNVFDEDFEIPGINIWAGEWMQQDELDAGETESAVVAKLKIDLKAAEDKCQTTEYRKQRAEEASEKHELEVCRLAKVLEANQLDKDGRSIESDGSAEPVEESSDAI